MGLTEFYHKNLPNFTPVVLLCLAFIAANAAGPTIVMLERMQAKSKAAGLDWFDFAIFVVFEVGLIGSVILAFRSRKFQDWQDERQRKITETELRAMGKPAIGHDAEGHLR